MSNLNHRLCCINSDVTLGKPFFDTLWTEAATLNREVKNLVRTMSDAQKVHFSKIPVWIFWLFQNETDHKKAVERLNMVMNRLVNAVQDANLARPQNGIGTISYYPKNIEEKTIPPSFCYSFMIH